MGEREVRNSVLCRVMGNKEPGNWRLDAQYIDVTFEREGHSNISEGVSAVLSNVHNISSLLRKARRVSQGAHIPVRNTHLDSLHAGCWLSNVMSPLAHS